MSKDHNLEGESPVTEPHGGRLWKSRTTRAAAELLVIFVGVTAAFLVEGYRERLNQAQDLRQAKEGILAELARYQIRGVEHADSIDASIDRWKTVDESGRQAVPGHYRIPGAPYPPTAAWDAAVASGVASMFDPELRLALGYFYTEFTGIHQNYVRRLEFIENEIIPNSKRGPGAFYTTSGQILPEFEVEMSLLAEFGADLRNLSERAAVLEEWLQSGHRAE
ncbi:MAG: hypothetical protein WD766_15115 [Gemmatimonadota bacterium]